VLSGRIGAYRSPQGVKMSGNEYNLCGSNKEQGIGNGR
jgi:hypothetical protein